VANEANSPVTSAPARRGSGYIPPTIPTLSVAAGRAEIRQPQMTSVSSRWQQQNVQLDFQLGRHRLTGFTTSLFAALNVETAEVLGRCHRRHRAIEFRKVLDAIEAAVPGELTVHWVLDNYATHKTSLSRRWLAQRPRYHVHFTPNNQVERWLALLTQKQIHRGVHRSTRALETAIPEYIAIANEHPKPFIWTKTADDILASVERF
jgi:hypothetical protein